MPKQTSLQRASKFKTGLSWTVCRLVLIIVFTIVSVFFSLWCNSTDNIRMDTQTGNLEHEILKVRFQNSSFTKFADLVSVDQIANSAIKVNNDIPCGFQNTHTFFP